MMVREALRKCFLYESVRRIAVIEYLQRIQLERILIKREKTQFMGSIWEKNWNDKKKRIARGYSLIFSR